MNKILIAAPDQLFRQILARLLCGECDRIDTASTTQEFERQCFADTYRLIITAFGAPLINGADLARRLRRRRTQTLLFLVADRLTEQQAMAYIESGADQIISIPVDRSRLVRKVREAMNVTENR